MSGGGTGKSNSGGMSSSMGSSNQASIIPQASNTQNDFSLTSVNQNAVTYLPLAELADIKLVTGPPMISSENGMLRSIVFMNTRGRDMGSVMADAKKVIEDGLKLPAGYSYTWSGQYESKIRTKNNHYYYAGGFLANICSSLFHIKRLYGSRSCNAFGSICSHRRNVYDLHSRL